MLGNDSKLNKMIPAFGSTINGEGEMARKGRFFEAFLHSFHLRYFK